MLKCATQSLSYNHISTSRCRLFISSADSREKLLLQNQYHSGHEAVGVASDTVSVKNDVAIAEMEDARERLAGLKGRSLSILSK